MISSEFSVAESEGVPDGLHGSRRDTFSTELECFNRLDVFNLGTINVYDEIDDGNDYIEESSLSSATSEDEIEASVVSFESHSDEGSFISRQNTQMRCDSMLMHNRGCDDSLALLSFSSMFSCETQIIHHPPMCNTSLNPHHTSSNSIEAAGPSVCMDVHTDKEVSSIESTSIGMSPVDSVDNSTGKIEITLEIWTCRSALQYNTYLLALEYKDPRNSLSVSYLRSLDIEAYFAYLEAILNKCM